MNNITVVIPTSPIPSHPNTEMIEFVISSIRYQLPNSRIIIMCDGVRDAVSHRKEQYEEYKKNLRFLFEKDFPKIMIKEFNKPSQQAMMLQSTLSEIEDPVMFFVEHDCVILPKKIDWNAISESLLSDSLRYVRFYWQNTIHPEHDYLMGELVELYGSKFIKTKQWSGWPHLSTKKQYARDLFQYFNGDNEMLESIFYGPCANSSWNKFRTGIYITEEGTQFFKHLDGRNGEDTKEW